MGHRRRGRPASDLTDSLDVDAELHVLHHQGDDLDAVVIAGEDVDQVGGHQNSSQSLEGLRATAAPERPNEASRARAAWTGLSSLADAGAGAGADLTLGAVLARPSISKVEIRLARLDASFRRLVAAAVACSTMAAFCCVTWSI